MPFFLLVIISAASLILLSPDLAPAPPRAPADAPAPLFETADRCMACHNGVTTSRGEDVSIGFDWRASMMANSSRDPYWQAAVQREIADHPAARAEIEDTCSTCHMPMMRYEAHMGAGKGTVLDHLPADGGTRRSARLAADGVSCSVCHQIASTGLGEPSSFTGGFHVDETAPWGQRAVLGPFTTDAGRAATMNSATGFTPREARHVQSSELCATCHTLYTESLDEQGKVVGKLPEQVPFLEWRHSAYASEKQSCGSCHMPIVTEPVAVTSVLGQPRDSVNRHVFRGGNFFMLGMLNRYRSELAVTALPNELEATRLRTIEHLQTNTAGVSIVEATLSGTRLSADVQVVNLAGHKLPTAYPSRRAWLRFRVRDAAGRTIFESGAINPNGSISGNANDSDPAAYEPHYDVIERADQVQIYESVMVDSRGQVTTGLLRGLRYIKDNRVLPRGFAKETAHADVAVQGTARGDDDFTGGRDQLRFEITVPAGAAPFTVDAELWYQPIGFRWARNLESYDAPETKRFVKYYDEMSSGSAISLARTSTTVR